MYLSTRCTHWRTSFLPFAVVPDPSHTCAAATAIESDPRADSVTVRNLFVRARATLPLVLLAAMPYSGSSATVKAFDQVHCHDGQGINFVKQLATGTGLSLKPSPEN